MRILAAAILAVHCAVGGAWAAGAAGAPPKGATVVGTVSARRGNCVVVVVAQGATLAPGQELRVRRARLLVALAKGGERLEVWTRWEDVGRIRARVLKGPRCCIAFVTDEPARTGIDGKPAPNIRPGDVVCRGGATREPPEKHGTAN